MLQKARAIFNQFKQKAIVEQFFKQRRCWKTQIKCFESHQVTCDFITIADSLPRSKVSQYGRWKRMFGLNDWLKNLASSTCAESTFWGCIFSHFFWLFILAFLVGFHWFHFHFGHVSHHVSVWEGRYAWLATRSPTGKSIFHNLVTCQNMRLSFLIFQ